MGRKRDDEHLFDELDIQIIAGLAMGMTQEAVGNWCCTPIHTGGVSERTVRNRMAEQREAYDRLLFRIGAAFKREKETIQDISRQEYREKLAKLRGKAYRVKDLALESGITNPTDPNLLGIAVKVAQSVEDREFGQAKQIVETLIDGRVEHFVWTTETRQQLLAQERDMLESAALKNSLPGEILEAEVVAADA